MRDRRFAGVTLILLAAAGARAQDVTGAARAGVYSDTDRTTVYRSLATVDAAWEAWHLFAKESVDVVSSASIDVRTSPQIDAMTSASRVRMSDHRFETTFGATHDDGRGHTVSLSAIYATEQDYNSVGGNLSGSIDVAARNTTLLASFGFNQNWISSVFDRSFAQTMWSASYTAGIAQVLGRSDALRLRYDGAFLSGYQASPYRAVRFGDWTASSGGSGVMTFANTIASLPENVPTERIRHAAVLEWVHGIGDTVGVRAEVRLAQDSWDVRSGTFGADLRVTPADWVLRVGYHFYLQSAASFFQDKYTMSPDSYTHYTSDKELGDERGHIASADASYAIRDWPSTGLKTWLDLQVDVLRYDYPGFTLLPSRTSVFGAVGIRIGF